MCIYIMNKIVICCIIILLILKNKEIDLLEMFGVILLVGEYFIVECGWVKWYGW